MTFKNFADGVLFLGVVALSAFFVFAILVGLSKKETRIWMIICLVLIIIGMCFSYKGIIDFTKPIK